MSRLPLPPVASRLAERWNTSLARLAPRERLAMTLALWTMGLALLWWLALAPALSTLRQAPARHAQLDAQLAQMQHLAATATALQSSGAAQAPRRDEALRALETATAALGSGARLTVLGDQATLTLRAAPPQALAQWLAQARVNARVMPREAKLTRDASGWNGNLVLGGPGLAGAN